MQRYFSDSKKDKFYLSSEDSYHIKKVMRLKVGDNVEVVIDKTLYICQIIDTILFSFITYLGIMDFKTIMEIMITMYAFKIIVALLDTPFMYLASKIKRNNAD